MPLGSTQKELATAVLTELKPPGSRIGDKELFFAYLVGKDKYVMSGKGDVGMDAMSKELDRLKFLSGQEKRIIKTLVKYDSDIINIDYYPSAKKILKVMDMELE
jgi:hypothetical protein